MGLFLSMSFFLPKVMQAQCPNLNFSLANFNYWQAYAGTLGGGVGPTQNFVIPGRHTIMDAEQLLSIDNMQDENCNVIPKVPLGFSYSARLGNDLAGAEMEALEYTMSIDSTNALLIVHFAWVMEENSYHEASASPKFVMAIKDSLGRIMENIPCGNVDFTASMELGSIACKTKNLIARNWTTVGFNLEPYMGRTIKVYFETRDCSQSGHYGYAYIVGECRPATIDLMYCDGHSAARLRGPDGFTWYKWTRSKQPAWKVEGQGRSFQNIVVTDPIDEEQFICEVTSELGANCSAVLRTVIAKTSIDADFLYGVIDTNGGLDFLHHNYESWYDTCARTATFVDLSMVRNSKKESILWEIPDLNVVSQDSLFTYTFPEPETDEPVDYLVRLTVYAENGCVNTSRGRVDQRIRIYPSPRVKIVGNDQVCDVDSTLLTAVAVKSTFANHKWTWEDSNKVMHTAMGDTLMIYHPGTYFLESLESAGCYAYDTHIVTTLRPNLENLQITNVDCYGEATGLFTHGTITGGTPPYQSFQWKLLDINGDYYVSPGNTSGSTYANLIAGKYISEAIDSRGCALYGEVIIKQNDSLKIQGIEYPTTCELDNGRLKLTATGGKPPYQFEIRKDDGTLLSSSHTVSGLAVGDYVIRVTDYVNCVTSATISVTATDKSQDTLSQCPTCETGSYTIPNSVRVIEDRAFEGCTALTSITIGRSVTTIGNAAFFGCSGLTEIYVKAQTPPSLGYNAFFGLSNTIPVHVPCGAEIIYQSAFGWSGFDNIIGDISPTVSVQSSDNIMGIGSITQANTCANNNTAIIAAIANTGYRFVQWNDGNTQNPRTITVTQDTVFTAEFRVAAQKLFSVLVTANYRNGGRVFGSGDYAKEALITIDAAANQGYRFVEWNDGNTDNPRELIVMGDSIFTAIFESTLGIIDKEPPTISVYPNPATDNIHIILPENIPHAVFTLYDTQGKVLIRQEVNGQKTVSVSKLASGIYIYHVRTEKENCKGKIIKQ
jgi:hypothetical protein